MKYSEQNLFVVMEKMREHYLKRQALAGKTPLRLASSFDFTWDFSLYSEGFMALNRERKAS